MAPVRCSSVRLAVPWCRECFLFEWCCWIFMTYCVSGICLPMILSFSSSFTSRYLCSSTDEEYIYFLFFFNNLGITYLGHREDLETNYRGSARSWKLRICGFIVSIYVSIWGCVILNFCLSLVLAMATYIPATLFPPSVFHGSAEDYRGILLHWTLGLRTIFATRATHLSLRELLLSP